MLRTLAGGGAATVEPSALAPLALDEQTCEWVRARLAQPASAFRLSVWRALKKRLYHYDAGVVAFDGFARNFLLSEAHWAQLLEGLTRRGSGVALDVGAGDGSLTMSFASLFDSMHVTEVSQPLVQRLARQDASWRGHVTSTLSVEALGGAKNFDAIFILNVLDRCKDPEGLLASARELLAPDGWLIVSIVLPATQADAAASSGVAQRTWRVTGGTFELAAASCITSLLLPAGFGLRALVRAPYFCAGDASSPVSVLDAGVFLLEKV